MSLDLNSLAVVRAVGTGDTQTYTMLRAATLMDAVVVNTNGGVGTVTVQNGANAITDPLATALIKAVIRPATGGAMVSQYKALMVGAVLTFVPSGPGINYEAYAYLYPTPAVLE